MREISGLHTSLFLDTYELKMVLWARKFSGTFEKRGPSLKKRRGALTTEDIFGAATLVEKISVIYILS